MIDIRNFVQETLDNYFYDKNIEVWDEEKINKKVNMPNEYIVFSIENETYLKYADNVPTLKKYIVNVIWIGKDISKKFKREGEILKVMQKNKFRVISSGRDLEKETNSSYYAFENFFNYFEVLSKHEIN